MTARNRDFDKDHLPEDYASKLNTFLDTKEKRLEEQVAAEQQEMKRKHDVLAASFREHCDRLRAWEAESKRRHEEDRNLFLSRRQHDADNEKKRQDRASTIRQHHHDALVGATQDSILSLEANIRRLGLDDEKPAATQQLNSVSVAVVDPVVANNARVAEIRHRKMVDVAARREKLQRQYVAAEQQRIASLGVQQRQAIEQAVTRAMPMLIADRAATLDFQKQRMEKDVVRQLSEGFLEGERTRRLHAFHETDAAFAVTAAVERVHQKEVFAAERQQKRVEEDAVYQKKHSRTTEFMTMLVEALIDVASDIGARNCVRLTDGTALRRVNPPSDKEWRDMKETRLSVQAVNDRLENKKEAVARAVALSNASPRAKRSSSVNLAAFSATMSGSLTKPFTPPSAGGINTASPGSSIIGLDGTMTQGLAALIDDSWDTESVDRALETVIDLDAKAHDKSVSTLINSIQDATCTQLRGHTNSALSEIVASGQKRAVNATNWWNSVLNELPPAVVFAFGDALSGVQLLGDARFVSAGVEADHLWTPDRVITAMSLHMPSPPAEGNIITPAKPAASATPAPGKGGALAKSNTPAAGPRPGSGNKGQVAPLSSSALTSPSTSATANVPSVSSAVLAGACAKIITRHHRKQVEALVRKDNASGYPPSLLFVGFPLHDAVYANELHAAIEKEVEDEERSWAPVKILLALEQNTAHAGGGGVGTHRSSLAGGVGGTNPNTPHGGPVPHSPSSVHGSIAPHSPESVHESASASNKRHAPPMFSAAAGKHHAAAVANLAATMFFPPVRMASIFLDIAAVNLTERYLQVAHVPNQEGTFHAVWAPPPSNSTDSVTTAPWWQHLGARDASKKMNDRLKEFKTATETWVNAAGQGHLRAPLPPQALNASIALNNLGATMSASSSIAPPVTACAARLSRTLHFIGHVTVDDVPPTDAPDVISQILAQEVRAAASKESKNGMSLAAPLLAPLALSTYALPDTTLDDLVGAWEHHVKAQNRWTLSELSQAYSTMHEGTLSLCSPTTGRRVATGTQSLPDVVLSRLDELKQSRRLGFRAIREMEIESGRCLYHSYLHILTILQECFAKSQDTFISEVAARKLSLTESGDVVLDRLYWELCDTEAANTRKLLADAVGILSMTQRQLQAVQLTTAVEIASSTVEHTAILVGMSHLVARRRALEVVSIEDDEHGDGSSAAWFESATEKFLDSVNRAWETLPIFPSQDHLQNLLVAVHENGVPLHEAIQDLWSLFSQNIVAASTDVLHSAVRIADSSSDARDANDAYLRGRANANTIASLQHSILQQSNRSLGQDARWLLVTAVEHESYRKKLSTGAQAWISSLFQSASCCRKFPEKLQDMVRPRTFEELMLPLPSGDATAVAKHRSRDRLCINTVQLEHLLLHLSMISRSGESSAVLLDETSFVHFLLSAQVSALHVHVPSSVEDMLLPLLSVTRTQKATALQTASHVELRDLLVPGWLVAHSDWTQPGHGGPKGKFVSREDAAAAFACACGGAAPQLDTMTWLAHIVTGHVDVSQYLNAAAVVREDVFHLHAARCGTPNVVQLRQFVESMDRSYRSAADGKEDRAVMWNDLAWWPLFGGGQGDGQQRAWSSEHVLQQLCTLWSASTSVSGVSCAPQRQSAGDCLATWADRETVYPRCLQWLLSTATNVGPTAIVEFAFAAACALRGPTETRTVACQPQALTTLHTKAMIPTDIVASVLRLCNPTWSDEDLKMFLLFNRPPCGTPVSPIASRTEEISFALLTASHSGQQVMTMHRERGSLLPRSEAVIV